MVQDCYFVLQIYYKQKDYWRFVWCVRYLCPHLACHVEQVFVSPVNISHGKLVLTPSVIFLTPCSLFQFSQLEPVLSSGVQSFGEGYKAERWLLHSLQGHILSAQLKPLLQHKTNTQKYYNGNLTSSKPLVSSLTYTGFLCVIMLLVILFCRWGLPVE